MDPKTGHYFQVPLFPQLLIPLKTKDEFVLPENHKESLDESLNNVTEVLIIGWKGTESHFNNYLSERLNNKGVTITIVNAGDKSIEKVLNHYNIKATYNFYENMNAIQTNIPGSFSQYIYDINHNKFEDFFNK